MARVPKKLPRGIRKRGDRFQVDVTVKGRRKTGTARTYEEAVALRSRLLEILEGAESVHEEWTLKDAVEKTLELPPPDGWRGSSYERTAEINARSATQFFGEDKPVNEIDLDDIEEWTKALERKGNSDSTINRKLSALRKVLKVALKYGAINELPPFPSQRKEPVNRIRQIQSDEEQEMLRIFEHLGWEDMRDLAIFLIETGVRVNEALNMRKEDVQIAPGAPAVALIYGKEGRGTKNGEVRSVPLTSRAQEAVKRQLNRAPKGASLWSLSYNTVRHRWDRVRSMMGLGDDPAFTIHVCRHTCCSRLVRSGVPLATVKQWMGHKTLDTTMRYAHLMPSDLFSAASALEAARV